MVATKQMTSKQLEELCRFHTPTISNAIEQFNVRLRNEGFTHANIDCRYPHMAPVAGFAATARIRSSMPPITGHCYYRHADWWRYIASVPAPRFIVCEDIDHSPGWGAFFDEIHARVSAALGAVAYLTNGSVRDIEAIEKWNFQLFSGSLSVSHSYAHVVEYGQPVEIAGLKISSGDLLHGDRHGIVQIPLEIAPEIVAKAKEVLASEAEFFRYVESPEFSLEGLLRRFEEMGKINGC